MVMNPRISTDRNKSVFRLDSMLTSFRIVKAPCLIIAERWGASTCCASINEGAGHDAQPLRFGSVSQHSKLRLEKSGRLVKGRLGAFLDFLRSQVPDMRGEVPTVPERVPHRAHPVAPEHVLDCHPALSARFQRPAEGL